MVTYAPGADPRNMNRSTLARQLRTAGLTCPESKVLKRRVFDDTTEGWKLSWSSSPGFPVEITWNNGTVMRSRSEEERESLRSAALAEIDALLRGLGYVTKREPRRLLVLRRMGA